MCVFLGFFLNVYNKCIFLHSNLSVSVFFFCFVFFSGVSMSPYSDIFVVKGKPLSLSCTVSSDSSTVSVYNLSLALDVYCNNTVPAQYLTYTNQLDMYIPETTLKDDRTYFCCYNGQMRTLKTVYVGGMTFYTKFWQKIIAPGKRGYWNNFLLRHLNVGTH